MYCIYIYFYLFTLFYFFQLVHSTVVDTSVVFPHRLGPPYKRALRTLMAEFVKKIIQSNGKKIPLATLFVFSTIVAHLNGISVL